MNVPDKSQDEGKECVKNIVMDFTTPLQISDEFELAIECAVYFAVKVFIKVFKFANNDPSLAGANNDPSLAGANNDPLASANNDPLASSANNDLPISANNDLPINANNDLPINANNIRITSDWSSTSQCGETITRHFSGGFLESEKIERNFYKNDDKKVVSVPIIVEEEQLNVTTQYFNVQVEYTDKYHKVIKRVYENTTNILVSERISERLNSDIDLPNSDLPNSDLPDCDLSDCDLSDSDVTNDKFMNYYYKYLDDPNILEKMIDNTPDSEEDTTIG
jgi:hypothetical protein